MIHGPEADPETWTLCTVRSAKVCVTLEIAHALEAPPPNIVYWLLSTAGIVASRKEDRKKVKHNQGLLPGGIKPSLFPLVLEHFVRWGMQASNYLNKLAKSSRDDEGKKNKAQFKTKWRSLISIQLQRNLAKVIADKLYIIHRMNTTVANY